MALYPSESFEKKFLKSQLIDRSKAEFSKSRNRKHASYKMVAELAMDAWDHCNG